MKWNQQVSKYFGKGELAIQYLLHFQNNPCFDLFNGNESTLLDEVKKWEQRISSRISFDIKDDKQGHVVITYGYSSSNQTIKPIDGISADNMGFGVSYSMAKSRQTGLPCQDTDDDLMRSTFVSDRRKSQGRIITGKK